jgi:hypothetical protein
MAETSTVITWEIAQLDRETSDGFVFTAHYRVNANNGTYTAGAYGSLGFERPDTLIPFSELTQDEVIGWVKEALTDEKVDNIEAALKDNISEQAQPTKASGVPW